MSASALGSPVKGMLNWLLLVHVGTGAVEEFVGKGASLPLEDIDAATGGMKDEGTESPILRTCLVDDESWSVGVAKVAGE